MASSLCVVPFRQPAGDIPPSHAPLGEAHLCDLYREDAGGELHCLHLPTMRVSQWGLEEEEGAEQWRSSVRPSLSAANYLSPERSSCLAAFHRRCSSLCLSLCVSSYFSPPPALRGLPFRSQECFLLLLVIIITPHPTWSEGSGHRARPSSSASASARLSNPVDSMSTQHFFLKLRGSAACGSGCC